MPRRCCVPYCKSNYDSSLRRGERPLSTFSFPRDNDLLSRWKKAIPRANWEPSKGSFVCSAHFNDNEVIRSDKVLKSNGSCEVFPLKNPKLVADAVPHIFPNLPQYLSAKKTPRMDPSKRRQLCDQRREELRQQTQEKDTIRGFSESKANVMQDTLNHGWNFKDVSGQLSASGEDESSSSLLVKRKSIRPKKAPEVYRPQLPPPKKKWKREICCNCHVSIKVFRKLVRCVQCDTGAMLCGECMNRRHKHSQHTLLQMPNTKIYHVLQGIFQRLRQEVNDLLCPEEDDEEETPLPSEGEEPLVEEPSQPTPYLTLSAMQITQEHSTAQQFDPLNTVIKQEDPTEEDMVVVHETEMGPIDIEIHEVSVPSVIGYVQPEREPSFSTTARKRKANADRAGTSAQTLKRAAVERPESRTQAQNRGVLERIPGEAGVAITPSVAVVSSQFCEDIAIKLEPPPPDEQRPPDELPLPLDYAKEELGDGTHEPGSAIHNIYGTQTRDNT